MSASVHPRALPSAAERAMPSDRVARSGTFHIVRGGAAEANQEQVRAKHLGISSLIATPLCVLIPSSAVAALRAERATRRLEALALVNALERVDISQRLLAHFCGFASASTVHAWCKGKVSIQVAKLNALVDVGDVWREEVVKLGGVPR